MCTHGLFFVAIAQGRSRCKCSLFLRMVATKHAHVRANNVLKYLRWRNTDASGLFPDGYRGEVFDLDPQAKLLGVREWKPEAKGQAGQFTDSTFEWSWRSWLAAFTEEDRDWVLGDCSIVEVGCGPILGTEHPCEGMKGPLWDFWFKTTPALAGASPAQVRVVYVIVIVIGIIIMTIIIITSIIIALILLLIPVLIIHNHEHNHNQNHHHCYRHRP